MLDIIPRQARAYLRDNESGASRPQRFILAEVGSALVKFNQNPQGHRVTVNEVIGYGLAELLGVQTPQGGLVEVPAGLLPHDGVLNVPETTRFDAFTFLSGHHFYSKHLDTATDRLAVRDLRGLRLDNPQDLAGAVVLDLLLNNWDRSPANLNMLLKHQGTRSVLILIDFGNAFGGGGLWELGNLVDPSLPPLDRRLPYGEGTGRYLAEIQNPSADFQPFLERLSEVTVQNLTRIIGFIPASWQLTEEEKTALLQYLSERARRLPEYLEQRLKRKEEWWE